jgi:hypothetical protein
MTKTFELNGKAYATDAETLKVLKAVVKSAKATGDTTAVQAIMEFGLMAGRIVEGFNITEAKRLGWFK